MPYKYEERGQNAQDENQKRCEKAFSPHRKWQCSRLCCLLSHNLRRRSQKMKRKARGTMILCDADARVVKRFLPHA